MSKPCMAGLGLFGDTHQLILFKKGSAEVSFDLIDCGKVLSNDGYPYLTTDI